MTGHRYRPSTTFPPPFLALVPQADKIKIRVDAATPGSAPQQTSPNASEPTRIGSDSFEGDILVRIKDFTGESADGAPKLNPTDGYFADDGERRGKTWSIFVRGRFLEEVNGELLAAATP
jgi:hypothetical protein